MKFERRSALLIALLILAFPARGQYRSSYGYTFNNPLSAFCRYLAWNEINARLTYKSMLKKKGYTDAQIESLSTKRMIEILGGEIRAAASLPGASIAPGASLFEARREKALLPGPGPKPGLRRGGP